MPEPSCSSALLLDGLRIRCRRRADHEGNHRSGERRWSEPDPCDGCEAKGFRLRYCPDHGASFCDGCWERIGCPHPLAEAGGGRG